MKYYCHYKNEYSIEPKDRIKGDGFLSFAKKNGYTIK